MFVGGGRESDESEVEERENGHKGLQLLLAGYPVPRTKKEEKERL